MSRERVFISHEYQRSPLTNVHKVNAICRTIKKYSDDELPISPIHAFSYFDEEDADYREDIMEWCFDQIEDEKTEKVYLFSNSSGCIREAKKALEVGKDLYICMLFVHKEPNEDQKDELYDREMSIVKEKYTDDEIDAEKAYIALENLKTGSLDYEQV